MIYYQGPMYDWMPCLLLYSPFSMHVSWKVSGWKVSVSHKPYWGGGGFKEIRCGERS